MARKTSKRGYFKSCPVDILQSKDCCCKDTVGPTSLRTYFTLEYANIETLSAVPTRIMTVCVCVPIKAQKRHYVPDVSEITAKSVE